MKRRVLLIGAMVLPTIGKTNAVALATLAAVVVLLGNSGDAMSKLSKGFKDLVGAGSTAYDFIAASREKERLKEISKDLTELTRFSNTWTVRSIDEYIKWVRFKNYDAEEIAGAWRTVGRHLDNTLISVRSLLSDVKSEQGDFVLMSAYASLNEALGTRSQTLTGLLALAPPTTTDELAQLELMSANYKVLMANTKEAIVQLNLYIISLRKR